MLRRQAAIFSNDAIASETIRNQRDQSAIASYTKAILLDSRFTSAYEHRADAYWAMKQNRLAIKDYDVVVTAEPENGSAFADRATAKAELGEYRSAIMDFNQAIRLKKSDDLLMSNTYEQRADSYLKIGDFPSAISDLSSVLRQHLANDTFLFSLSTIRSLYPEFDGVSDDVLIDRIRLQFWPQYDHQTLAKQLRGDTTKFDATFYAEYYEKRGDAYLMSHDYGRGVGDFNRIFRAIPNMAQTVDRWRLLGFGSGGDRYLLDIKSVELPTKNKSGRLWIKFLHKNKTSTIEQYEFDCQGKSFRQMTSVTYTVNGNVANTSSIPTGWQQVIPETTGEQFYSGLCSSAR